MPGVTPGKWVRIWNERRPEVRLELVPVDATGAGGLLRERGADAGLLRLPVDRTDLSAIPLYTETTVVVVPKDHFVAAADEVTLDDLADEIVQHPLDDSLDWPDGPPGRPAFERPATTADAIELVAAGVGLLVVPQSLARLYHRRDLTYRPLTDAPQSQVALSWREDATTDLVDDFIGIVRGRTVNSTRGRAAQERAAEKSKPARAKAAGGAGDRKGAKGASTGQGASRTARAGKRAPGPQSGSAGSRSGSGARRGKPRGRS
ncbi:LysR family substrate-binding domain-containing protein [Actinacidiphila acidipaludis]|uniref:LysR family substrate-binding domain-containing protein n=1 Tax=Actinacidiphila acidipaludis TaxID=2873382 RepID=UPI0027DF45B9|nr:LysR family substrate-binding domain-containing protein [Streptomyces acidipaludis]